MNAASILTDVRCAMRQLREFRDVGRALDALERVEAELTTAAQLELERPEGELEIYDDDDKPDDDGANQWPDRR
jgi:hypothetical protein